MAKNFRIVCISDTHGYHDKLDLPDGDLLIHAGDFTSGGTSEEVFKFLKWIRVMSNRFTYGAIYIAGNHDRSYDVKYLNEFEVQLDINKKGDLPIWLRSGMSVYSSRHLHYLNNSGLDIDGLKVWGSPITPWYDGDFWAFNAHKGGDISRYWEMIPEDTDVLITHGPPARILDYFNRDRVHAGCYDLRNKVERIKPKLHVFGHIHDGYGVVKEGGVIYVNASIVDAQYTVRNKPLVINIQI